MSAERPTCFFCKKPINGKAERHHIRPRRTFRRGEDHKRGNLAPVHSECHKRAHRELDNPKWNWKQFKEAMEPLNYGEGIFAD